MITTEISKSKLLLFLLLSIFALPASGQNIFTTIKDKISGAFSSENTAKKTPSADNKTTSAALDPFEMSLDDNLAVPAINEKYHDAIADHMNNLAKKIASHKRERVETMRRGEVVVATISTDLLFAPNDTVLTRAANTLLQPYANLMRQPGMYKLIVVCHTDNTGSEYYTDMLSEARVNNVSEYLLHGLNDNHATLVPYALGASEPIRPNNTMENRTANRRLEIFIVPDDLMIEMAKSNKLQ